MSSESNSVDGIPLVDWVKGEEGFALESILLYNNNPQTRYLFAIMNSCKTVKHSGEGGS